METMKCECMQWARTSLMVFDLNGHHPGCRHYEVPTVEQFVEQLFTDFAGEKADRLALVRKGASIVEVSRGWNRATIIARLNKFMELHRKEDESSVSRVGRNENPSPKSPKPRVIPHGQGRSSREAPEVERFGEDPATGAVEVLEALKNNAAYPFVPVVCLCGSTRFKAEFEQVNFELTMRGFIVLTVGVFSHADGLDLTEQQRAELTDLHLHKIQKADAIYVINPGGYTGLGLRPELALARKQHKLIVWMEDPDAGEDKS